VFCWRKEAAGKGYQGGGAHTGVHRQRAPFAYCGRGKQIETVYTAKNGWVSNFVAASACLICTMHKRRARYPLMKQI
jgi:hypothetical protein